MIVSNKLPKDYIERSLLQLVCKIFDETFEFQADRLYNGRSDYLKHRGKLSEATAVARGYPSAQFIDNFLMDAQRCFDRVRHETATVDGNVLASLWADHYQSLATVIAQSKDILKKMSDAVDFVQSQRNIRLARSGVAVGIIAILLTFGQWAWDKIMVSPPPQSSGQAVSK